MSPRLLFTVVLVTMSVSACRKNAPLLPPAVQASALPPLRVDAKAKMLFTFAVAGSAFQTVNELGKVPENARGWVRVVDLQMKPERRLDLELVYVADLRQPRNDGTYPYVVMSRGAFETLAQNRAGSALAAASRPAAGSAPASRPIPSAAARSAKVVLYSTSWCPACRAARDYLTTNKIPFVEKNIEEDESAAEELLQKSRAQGISTSGVPILDVNGTLMQGFNPERLTSLLGGT